MILGCGRSGTSILGELFDGLGQYVYESEPPFDEVMTANFSQPRAFKVPRESAQYPPPAGLSFPIAAFQERAPHAVFLWIVRHPLDAIASLRVGIADDWGHHPRPPDWRGWLERPLLERCAHNWSFLNTAGFGQVAAVAKVVRFEDMIADPHRFAVGICGFVDMSATANGAHVSEWAARVQDTNNAAFIEAKTSRRRSRPDHTKRVGRWRENLSRAEAEGVWPLVAGAARRFGYTPAGP